MSFNLPSQKRKKDEEKLPILEVQKEAYIEKGEEKVTETSHITKGLCEEVICMSEIYFPLVKQFLLQEPQYLKKEEENAFVNDGENKKKKAKCAIDLNKPPLE